jgi:multidrug efflux system outer membrane protein
MGTAAFTRWQIAAVVSALLVAGCAALPPEQKPLAVSPPLHLSPSALASSDWPSERWWEAFNDAQLNRLVATALEGSPDLDLAAARVRGARQAEAAALAASGPSLTGNAMLEREMLTGNGLIPPPYRGTTINEGRATIDFSYELDWWGKNRQLVAAGVSQTRAAEAEAAAARLLVASGVAQAYFLYQSDLRRQAIARELLDQRQSLYRFSAARYARGLDAMQPRRQSEADIAGARFNLEQIDAGLALGRNQLAALLGRGPGDLPPIARALLPAANPGLPENLGIDLLGRRPDIQAQRSRIEAAAQLIDVARAQFYPDISIAAFLGFSSIGLGKLTQSGSEIAGVAPALRLPLFDAGRLRANLGSSRAALDAAIAQYNQTLVDAVHQVADQADTLASLARQQAALEESLQSAQRLLALAEARYQSGLADIGAVLVARAAVLAQSDLQAQLASRQLSAKLALIKALGGGYQARLAAEAERGAPPSSSNH